MSRDTIPPALRLFRDFTGHDGELMGKIEFPHYPKTVICIGELIDVGYVTVRDGQRERYRHEFAAKSRPLLLAQHDGKQLFIYGGRYDFTERGIVDRKPQ